MRLTTIHVRRLLVAAVPCAVALGLFIRQLSCFPVVCSLLPSGEVGIRTPEPTLGPREDQLGTEVDWCHRLNALETRADSLLTGAPGADQQVLRADFDVANKAYRDGLAAWRKGLRATIDEGGPRQPRCRADKLAEVAHKAGLQLPEKYRKRSEHTTWGQYTGLMMDLASSLLNVDECRDFHMVAPWIWQWCSYGDWFLPDFDPSFGRLMPYIEEGKVRSPPNLRALSLRRGRS